jgi:hypothetical protein
VSTATPRSAERPSDPPQPIQEARARLDAGAALSKDDLAALIGVSKKSIDRLVKTGSLPGPDLLFNLRTIRWSAKSVRRFIDGAAA